MDELATKTVEVVTSDCTGQGAAVIQPIRIRHERTPLGHLDYETVTMVRQIVNEMSLAPDDGKSLEYRDPAKVVAMERDRIIGKARWKGRRARGLHAPVMVEAADYVQERGWGVGTTLASDRWKTHRTIIKITREEVTFRDGRPTRMIPRDVRFVKKREEYAVGQGRRPDRMRVGEIAKLRGWGPGTVLSSSCWRNPRTILRIVEGSIEYCNGGGAFSATVPGDVEEVSGEPTQLRTAVKGQRQKLTKEEVLDVVSRCHDGEPRWHVAESLGVSRGTVNHIMTGRYWSDVTGIERKGV